MLTNPFDQLIEELCPSESQWNKLFDDLWPICRSLTGPGLRQSLDIIDQLLALKRSKIASGTKVYDWTIPDEWSVEEAFIADDKGQRVIDFKDNNLHVMGYSTPVDTTLSYEELLKKIYTIPDMPNAIPYVTSYYSKDWGFCLSENQKQALKPGPYRVCIKSTLKPGHLDLAEYEIINNPNDPHFFLVSTYLCHPSMANNELSGPILATFMALALKKFKGLKQNFHFVFTSETIGALAFIKENEKKLSFCQGGLVLTCCGDDKALNYKRSRRHDSPMDKVACDIVKAYEEKLPNVKIRDFFPSGSDERQYCSPGLNLPIGSLTRSMYTEYPEYHTSLDDKNFVSYLGFKQSFEIVMKMALLFNFNRQYVRKNPYGEPMLGQYGLYPNRDYSNISRQQYWDIMYLLSYSDGEHDLVDIAKLVKHGAWDLIPTLCQLLEKGLLLEKSPSNS